MVVVVVVVMAVVTVADEKAGDRSLILMCVRGRRFLDLNGPVGRRWK